MSMECALSVIRGTCCARPACRTILAEDEHAICLHCYAHGYKGKFYSRKEWDAWINGVFEEELALAQQQRDA